MDPKKANPIININDLKILWRIIYKNWYIPILFAAVFYLLGFFYTYKLTSISQGSVELLLKSNDTYYQSSLITEKDFYGSTYRSYVDNSNEIRILKSYDIMKETLSRLKDRLQVSYFIIGRVRTTEQFNGVPFQMFINTVNPGMTEIPVSFTIKDYDHYEISYVKGEQENVKQGEFGKELIDLDFNMLVNRTPNFTPMMLPSLKEIRYQVVIHSVENLVGQYQQRLTIENPDYTNVLTVKLDDILPERAVVVLDTLTHVYMENSLHSRFDINDRTLSFIDKQLSEVSASLKEMEDTMQFYKQDKAILDLSWEQEDNFTKMATYDGQRTVLNLQIESLNDLERYIIEDKDPQFLPPSVYVVSSDKFLATSVEELYNMQLKLNELYGNSTLSNPNIIGMKQNIKKTKQDLLVYINNTRRATRKIIENINREMNSYLSSIKAIPQKQRDLLSIQRKVEVNQNLFVFLLQKRANTKIAKATIVPDIKVIDSPRNLGIVKPDKKKIISSFISVGLLLSFIVILIRFFVFTKIENIEQLKEASALPVVGELPFAKNISDKGITVHENPNSRMSESFRTLRTNIQYIDLNKGVKTILITSNGPGEGKTFTAINLATILAKSNKTVIILELDLHKPRVQKALEMSADKGISTYVIGQDSIDDIVKPTAVENMYTILSGPIPPNPSEIVMSEKLKEIIRYAQEKYDYVIIDTPPAGLLSDAIFLMQYADYSLFVLNTKYTNKRVISHLHEAIRNNNLKHIYLVLNGVKRLRTRYYYNKYGYGYGYGYGSYSYSGRR